MPLPKEVRQDTHPRHKTESFRAPDYRNLFESIPGLYLLLTPDLRIVTASQDYLLATHQKRDKIKNCHMFDIFPDNPDLPGADGVSNLRTAFERVLQLKSPQIMRLQRYDVRNEVSGGGKWVEKYWSPSNYPLFASGSAEVTHIVHRVQDVTSLVQVGRLPDVEELFRDAFEAIAINADFDSAERVQKLRAAESNFLQSFGGLQGIRQESHRRVDRALDKLETEVSRSLKRLEWRKPYYDAIFESHPDRQKRRVQSAEWAISRRLEELSIVDLGQESLAERRELTDAYIAIQKLKYLAHGPT